MVYRMVDWGKMRGMFALHYQVGAEEKNQSVLEKIEDAVKSMSLIPGKRIVVLDHTEKLEYDAEEMLSLVKVLRDWNFFVVAHVDGTRFPLFARDVGSVEAFVEPDGKWLQFTCQGVIFNGIPLDADGSFKENTVAVSKFVKIAPSTPKELVAQFVAKTPYPWVFQIGSVGGMRVTL